MRTVKLECETVSALVKTRKIQTELENLQLSEPLVSLLVKMDCGSAEADWQPSSLGREFQFLVSHTVHHFAMIGSICHDLGIPLDDDFGVAPSILRHRDNSGS